MTGAADISWPLMAAIYGALLVPLALLWLLRVPVLGAAAVAIGRMTVQLAFVAVYLELLFRLNNPWLNLLWVLVMVVIAAHTALRSASLRVRELFAPALLGVAAGSLSVVAGFVLGILRPDPLFDAQLLIPITGMILGNSLRSNVLVLERFYATIRKNEREYVTYLTLGANLSEATQPYLREALRAMVMPTIATMTTLGLVFLPGMMTGQILGGSPPLVAIKYQIAIMVAILTATVITALVSVWSSMRIAFDGYQMVRPAVFRD